MRINVVFSSLISVYQEWSHFLVNPRYIRRGSAISWQNYKTSTVDDPIMPTKVKDLVDNGQYTFQIIEDGAIIQIYYVYKSDTELVSASLAYYSAGISEDLPVGWYRIDYDPTSERKLIHSKCHMHLGLFPNTRLVVDGVPTPKQFVEFVISTCYPDIYRQHRIDLNGEFKDENKMFSVNAPCFTIPQEEACRFITHVRIPAQKSQGTPEFG